MTDLKFYRKESELFEKEQHINLSDSDAKIMIKKLARHYKVNLAKKGFLKFRKHDQHGTCFHTEDRFSLSHNPNILLICHEFAHLHNYQKFGSGNHTTILMKFIKKSLKYTLGLLDLDHLQIIQESYGKDKWYKRDILTYTFKNTIFKTITTTDPIQVSESREIQVWQKAEIQPYIIALEVRT